MSTRENRLDALRKLSIDDKFAAFLDLELQSLEAQVYRVEYPDLRARNFIPLKSDVDEGAETFAYRVWDVYGDAIWAANYSGKLPTTALRGEKVVGKVEGIVAGYGYSRQDLRAAAKAGVPLDSELAITAREAIERMVDDVALNGDSKRGFIGLANHPNVDVTNATASWSNPATSPEDILADMQAFAKHIRSTTKEIFSPDTLLLPTSAYDAVATTLLNTANANGETILSAFLRTQPWIKNVASWPKLETASSSGGTLAIAYKKDPRVLQLCIPMETQQYEPQLDGMIYQIPMEMRFGGLVLRQPKTVYYMKGV